MPEPDRGALHRESVVHASQILSAFQSSGEALRLRDVVQRTGLGKGMCFRLLHTLHHFGLLEKVDATPLSPGLGDRTPQAPPHRLRRARARTPPSRARCSRACSAPPSARTSS